MKKTFAAKKVVGLIIIGCLVLSLGGVFAASNAGTNIVAGGKNLLTQALDALVKDGTLTQNQADAIPAKMDELRKAQRTQDVTTRLDALVKDGTLTKDNVTAIIAYMEKKDADRKAEMDKLKGMTQEQIQAYFKEHKAARTDMFKDLVDQKVLTQTQADAVKKALGREGRFGGGKGGFEGKRGPGGHHGAPEGAPNGTFAPTGDNM